jgi:DNA-binding CsgD family transcriptional regulator
MARLFDEGRFDEAGVLFDTHRGRTAPIRAALLRAKLLLRTRERHQAISLLNTLRPAKTDDRVTLEMLLGEAYAVTNDYGAADEHFAAALELARTTDDSELVAAVGFRIGRRHVMSNDPATARSGLTIARCGQTLDARLDALHLESWILGREMRAQDQARTLMKLLRSIDPNSERHMEHRAVATYTLAARARETFVPEAIALVEAQLAGAPWPKDFEVARFQATKALGWTRALQGDYFNAFRYLKQSAATTSDPGWRTVALCDRAYLALTRGERTWFRQELSDAEESARTIPWDRRDDESVVALLLLAELMAPVNAALASGYLARFRSLGAVKDPLSLFSKDERYQAMIDYSTGVVDLHLGDRKLAVERLAAALRLYDRIGYEWRAARCALRLYEATKKPAFLDAARDKLNNYMNSWLADELRAFKYAEARGTGLSPMRDKVFRLLCEGKSNVEISGVLGITVSTVANHAKAVLKAFGVNSRHALLAEARRRSLI